MNTSHDQRGIALLLTILVMGTVSVAVLLGLSQQSANAIVLSNEQTNAMVVRSAVFGCLDEVFVQLAGDPTWSSTTVTTPDFVCTVTVIPSGADRDILVTLNNSGVTRGVKAHVTVTPLVVTDVEEVLSL